VFADLKNTSNNTNNSSSFSANLHRQHLHEHKDDHEHIDEYHATKTIFPMECDHSSFDSVRDFCEDMKNELRLLSEIEGHRIGIDVLCLNAAILLGEDSEAQFTKDNLELTIQTNHFSPFLIANSLMDFINVGARVVVTSSGLHAFENFKNFEGVIDPNTGKIEAGFQMINGNSFHYKKCYAVSKLCNVAFCVELDIRLRKRNAKAICFSPGLIPTSGLFKHQKLWNDTVLKKLGIGMGETEEWGGALLAWMAISDKAFHKGGCYWRAPFGISRRGGKIPDDLFLESLSEEATSCKNRETLWKISSIITDSTFNRLNNTSENTSDDSATSKTHHDEPFARNDLVE
jgi:NAD(P)-dependent dehydrogenase (short-subunit alcohol dehydrogenase family)